MTPRYVPLEEAANYVLGRVLAIIGIGASALLLGLAYWLWHRL